MSAICGILRFDGDPARPGDVERMLSVQGHRAPDRRATWNDRMIAMAHGLMRVTHEDSFDAQPARDRATGNVIVADVRLDNREELAAELGLDDEKLSRLPDSAVVLAAFGKWGEGCVERLVGDFAFAVWQPEAQTLFLARDHMGQRGVHFHRGDGFFAFSTDVSGLMALPDVPRVLSEATIAHRLMLVPEWDVGATHLAGIDCLGGGRCMRLGRDGAVVERSYWIAGASAVHENRPESYYVETYRRILEEAVACRLRRLNRPAALAMSGGFDSAAIAGLARPYVTRSGRKLLTVTAALPATDADSSDPRPWVEICRREMLHLDVRYWEGGGSIYDGLDRAFIEADGPVSAGHYVDRALFEIARSAGTQTFLDGMGGDYTLNPRGYWALARLLHLGEWRRFVHELRATARSRHKSIPWVLRHQVLPAVTPVSVRRFLFAARRGFAPIWRGRMAAPNFADDMIASGKIDRAAVYDPAEPVTSMREESLIACRWMQRYPPPETFTAAARFGLEYTRPFHDKRVVEFALAVPEDLYCRDGLNRHLARRALADVYPKSFQTRGWEQTAGAPDFEGTFMREQSRFLSEADRLAKKPKLARLVDFQNTTARLRDRRAKSHPAPALNALLLARYVEKFEGDNR